MWNNSIYRISFYPPYVFSSSIKGDLFEGAVGSTLYIDEVELSYTDKVND